MQNRHAFSALETLPKAESAKVLLLNELFDCLRSCLGNLYVLRAKCANKLIVLAFRHLLLLLSCQFAEQGYVLNVNQKPH